MTPPGTGDRADDGPASAAGRPLLGDEDLLAILEEAIADERAAQDKYRRGLERCADPAACEVFEQLLREERAHEKALEARYVEVKKRIGLHGAGRS
jgi:rubrerythrin